MKTEKEVRKRARKSKRAAIKVSIEHHKAISECTQQEFKEYIADQAGEVPWSTELCGMCVRFMDPDQDCEICPLAQIGQECNSGDDQFSYLLEAFIDWEDAKDHRDHQKAFRKLQKEEKKMVTILESLL